MKKAILLLFISTFFTLTSQNPVDSLLSILKSSKHDTLKIKTLYQLSEVCDENDIFNYASQAVNLGKKILPAYKGNQAEKSIMRYLAGGMNNMGYVFMHQGKADSAVKYYEASIKINEDMGDIGSTATAVANMGGVYIYLARFNEALKTLEKALHLYEKSGNRNGAANVYYNLGRCYHEMGKTETAIDNYIKALKIFEKTNDKERLATTMNNLGMIYDYMGQEKKAFEYLNKGLSICEEIGNRRAMMPFLINLGVLCQETNRKKELEYLELALKISRELGDKPREANILLNIAANVVRDSLFDKALEHARKALQIEEEVNDKAGISFSLETIGKIYASKKQFTRAVEYGTRSLAVAQELNTPENIKRAAGLLALSYYELKDYKKAYEYNILSSKMRDTILTEASFKQINEMQAKYESEKKQLQIEALAKEKEQQEIANNAELKKQRVIVYAICAGLILVIGFSIYVSRSLSMSRKQNKIIAQAKDEIAGQKKKVDEHQKEIIDSITYAKRLQHAILPSHELIKKEFPESFVYYKPKDIVAGDFYWLEISDNTEHSLIAVADCTGHGVPGAMVSVVCSNALNRAVKEFGITDPGKILDKTRELVIETFDKSGTDVKDGMDISLLSIQNSSEKSSGAKGITVQWAGANNSLWYIENEVFRMVKCDKQPIGKIDAPHPFTTHTFELSTGSCLYLYTDGYADQFGGSNGKKFKYKPLENLLVSIHKEEPEKQKEILDRTFENWRGNLEQVDDVCIIGIRI